MATAFAITGIQRSSLKHYRPSYQTDLPPIYEDAISGQRSKQNKWKCTIPSNDDYMYVPSFIQNGGFVHDYEEIDIVRLSHNAYKPGTSTQPSNSMLHGIMSNRMQVKNTLQMNTQSDCDSVNEDTDKPTTTEHVSSLRRASSVYQGFPLKSEGTNAVKTSAETAGEMFSNSTSTNKWPKLEPQPFKLPYFLGPAQNKIKKRCFAVCFVILVLVIGTFVVVSLDGWVYGAKGHGLQGKEKPMLWDSFILGSPGENITDVTQTSTVQL